MQQQQQHVSTSIDDNRMHIFYLYGRMTDDHFETFLADLYTTISQHVGTDSRFVLWVDTRALQNSKLSMLQRIRSFVNEHEEIFHNHSDGTVVTFNQQWVKNLIDLVFKIKKPKSAVFTGRSFQCVQDHLCPFVGSEFFDESVMKHLNDIGITV